MAEADQLAKVQTAGAELRRISRCRRPVTDARQVARRAADLADLVAQLLARLDKQP